MREHVVDEDHGGLEDAPVDAHLALLVAAPPTPRLIAQDEQGRGEVERLREALQARREPCSGAAPVPGDEHLANGTGSVSRLKPLPTRTSSQPRSMRAGPTSASRTAFTASRKLRPRYVNPSPLTNSLVLLGRSAASTRRSFSTVHGPRCFTMAARRGNGVSAGASTSTPRRPDWTTSETCRRRALRRTSNGISTLSNWMADRSAISDLAEPSPRSECRSRCSPASQHRAVGHVGAAVAILRPRGLAHLRPSHLRSATYGRPAGSGRTLSSAAERARNAWSNLARTSSGSRSATQASRSSRRFTFDECLANARKRKPPVPRRNRGLDGAGKGI